jgi:hypothetical protein
MSENRNRKERAGPSFLVNLRAGDFGFLERAGKVFNNVGRKVVRRQACCGNYGDPGC